MSPYTTFLYAVLLHGTMDWGEKRNVPYRWQCKHTEETLVRHPSITTLKAL